MDGEVGEEGFCGGRVGVAVLGHFEVAEAAEDGFGGAGGGVVVGEARDVGEGGDGFAASTGEGRRWVVEVVVLLKGLWRIAVECVVRTVPV